MKPGKTAAMKPGKTAPAKRRRIARTRIEIHPLTSDRWEDLATLFGERGACGGCWCMWWRLARSAFEKGKGAGNRRSLRRIVSTGGVPGLIAY